MLKLLLVALGGSIGAVARYAASGWAQRRWDGDFPAGTLLVNLLGCLLLGALMALVQERQLFSPNARLFWTMGVLGAFTTFSTFGYETLELLEDQRLGLALGSVLGNVVLGVFAVLLGRTFVRALWGG